MKATGIVRKIDALGRIVIPKEIRNSMNIKDGDDDSFEIFFDPQKGEVLLRKHQPGCHICGSIDNLIEIDGEKICKDCHERISKKFAEKESQ